MLIKEYRVVVPLSLEEYRIGQLYSMTEASKNETGGGEGVEIVTNEPFSDGDRKGQYTRKIYHLSSKVPHLIRAFAPKGSLELHEEAWNCFPYFRTVVTNPGFMKDKFHIIVTTIHVENDVGEIDNVHNLPIDKLSQREVVHVDIVNDPVAATDYKEEWDPKKFESKITGRGPLKSDWQETSYPIMCCYKLVECEFKWFGLQGTVESKIQKATLALDADHIHH